MATGQATLPRIAVASRVGAETVSGRPRSAADLAAKLQLPLLSAEETEKEGEHDFLLRYSDEGRLELELCHDRTSLRADFSNARLLYRLKQGLKREMLVRAVGVRSSRPPRVIDATAGLGQDAFLLAAAGCHVTLIEHSPVVCALLRDALDHALASDNSEVRAIAARMALHQGDSLCYLSGATEVDVIYLDPMFPPRRKSARVKKNRFILQRLLDQQPSTDAGALLALALRRARQRVVVKRPRLAGYLGERKAHWQLIGRSSRFDVYAAPSADNSMR